MISFLELVLFVCRKNLSTLKDNRFILRRAIANDNVSLSQLNRQTFLETYVYGSNTPYGKDDIKNYFRSSVSPQSFADDIADPQQATWIVEDKIKAKPVAFANAGPCTMSLPEIQPEKDGELYRLYILRDYQDDGLGDCLMKVSLSWLEKQFPGRPIWLGVWSGNSNAQSFHQQYNFKKVGERYYQIGEYKRHSFIMRRDNPSS